MDNGAAGLAMAAPTNKPKAKGNHTEITKVFKPFPNRGFSQQAIERYKIDVGSDSASYEAKYPLFDINGNHVSNKVRRPEKKFLFEGEPNDLGLFGRHAFPAGSAKAITVTEGQDDAIAVYQMSGCRYPAVSVHSASTAERDMRNDFEYLNSFDTIVICFDNDEAGLKAAKACSSLPFPIGKVKVMTPRKHKDPNEYLLAKDSEGFSREWWSAPTHKPDGLVFAKDMLDDILNRPQHFTVPYPWEGINKLTYGIRLSELVLMMADTGSGKSSIFREIAYSILTNKDVIENDYKVGMLFLEEPVYDTALGLMSIHAGKPYHLPDTEKSPEELTRVHGEVFADNRVILYDSFGSNDIEVIVDRVRHMAAMGCKYIFLDHLSIIVSDGEGDERKLLDAISTKLKTLTIELDISVFCIVHTNRSGQARGSAGPEKVANMHLVLERDKHEQDEWRRNISKITLIKNRFAGRTGPAEYLWYNNDTGRLSSLNEEEIQKFENGESMDVWT